MPRRRQIERRLRLPDPKYQSPLVTQFVNNLMKRGKKSIAEKIFYRAVDLAGEKSG